ncbi:unannotated protein [freshwater metagenome]|uniref:Unannotated protein n=1 Tax=freshwater metagenome TaxID=449393 RepID=A0A6J6X9D6_9ZZZZ
MITVPRCVRDPVIAIVRAIAASVTLSAAIPPRYGLTMMYSTL